jgi:excinuclease UvrABC ATPase subunit
MPTNTCRNLVAMGTPEEVAAVAESLTGQYLARMLGNGTAAATL